MTDHRKAPEPQRRQAEGETGAENHRVMVPAWGRKRVAETLLRFQGQYHTPETLTAQAAQQAAEGRAVRLAHDDALSASLRSPERMGAAGSPISETPGTHPAERFSWGSAQSVMDSETGELLPCRSLETTQYKTLSGPHKKTAMALSLNVAGLCEKYGANRIGFLTLTFSQHITCAREAQRRFNSLASNALKPRYPDYIRVMERQKNGRIHYHLLVVMAEDIRTGFDYEAVSRKDYKSASKYLAREWAFLRKSAIAYGFGRTELLPIKGSAQALGQYVGKYIGKHIGSRIEEDKGVRLVTCTRGARIASSRFTAIGSQCDKNWRAKVETFARQMSAAAIARNPHHPGIHCIEDLSFNLGPKWAYHWRDYIFSLPPADLSVPF